MCLWTSPYARVKPTERAKSLGRLLGFILIILFITCIMSFISGDYYEIGLFTIFLILTGYCAIREQEVYNIEQLLCVVFFSGYLWVTTLVDLILYLVTEDSLYVFSLITLFLGIIFFFAAVWIGKLLYDELRLNYQRPPDDPMMGGGGMFGGMGGGMFGGPRGGMPQGRPASEYQAVNQGQNAQGNIPPNRSGFQAFQGQGHSLV